MRSLIAAFRFLTRIPIPGAPTRPEELAGAVGYFPLVGALVGLAVGGAHLLFLNLWPAAVAAVLAIGIGLLLTGAFHEDAVADSADALGGGYTTERVLEIMKDSRVGTFGSVALWVLLTLRWSALVSLGYYAPLAMAGAMAVGRWTASPMLLLMPPLSTGLSRDVGDSEDLGPLAVATVLMVAIVCYAAFAGVPGVLTGAIAGMVGLALWGLYLRVRLGGQTGDLLGAGNQIAESLVLLAVVAALHARWS